MSATDVVTRQAVSSTGDPIIVNDPDPTAAKRTGSQFAVDFDGGFQALRSLDPLQVPDDNFGYELWVRPRQVVEGFALVLYSGDTRYDGWGIYQNGETFGVSYGGVGRFGSAPAVIDQWIHLAVVVENGFSTFYANGVLAGHYGVRLKPPGAGFALGAHPQAPLGEFFAGTIDEVRFFTFEPGQFDPNDLLLHQRAYTQPASGVTATAASLHAQTWPPATGMSIWFEWGLGQGYTEATRTEEIPAGTAESSSSLQIIGLLANSEYSFRVVTSNELGVVRGLSSRFKTGQSVTSLANDGPGSLRQALQDALPGETVSLLVEGTITLSGSGLEFTKDVTLLGGDAATHIVDGGGAVRPFLISTGVVARIEGLTIRGGRAEDSVRVQDDPLGSHATDAGSGGGVRNMGTLTLRSCVIESNRAGNGAPGSSGFFSTELRGSGGGWGGGIWNQGSLLLDRCLVRDNRAGDGGPGVSSFTMRAGNGGRGGDGGGIANSGDLVVQQSSIVRNFAGTGAPGGSAVTSLQGLIQPAGDPGGPGNGGGLVNTASCTVRECTFSGNGAGNSGTGSGAAAINSGTLMFIASTVASNGLSGGSASPGLHTLPGASALILQSSLVAANGSGGYGPDLVGTNTSAGHNLLGVLGTNATVLIAQSGSDQVGTPANAIDARLLPLTFTGPFCAVHGLLADSPAIDAGDDAVTTRPLWISEDQCFNKRSVGGHVDVGAVEFDPSLLPLTAETLNVVIDPSPDLATGTLVALLYGVVNPQGTAATAGFDFGTSAFYRGDAGRRVSVTGNTNTPIRLRIAGLVPGYTYHYRINLIHARRAIFGEDHVFTVPGGAAPRILGDRDGDGAVSGTELTEVLHNYWGNAAWLQMTNVAGLGGTNVTFQVPDLMLSPFTVESTTDFKTWTPEGPATPRFEFSDTNAPAISQRFYRLRTP